MMCNAPERIWACYDAVKNRAYWAGPDGLYQTDCLVGEYIRADIAAERERKLAEALNAIIARGDEIGSRPMMVAIARAVRKELGYE